MVRMTLMTSVAMAMAIALSPIGAAQEQPVEPGFAYGTTKDRAGKPLANVVVFLDGAYDMNHQQTTKADGAYRIRLTPGAYVASASMKWKYEGQTYKIDLKPDSTDTFNDVDGAVRNFTWELTGEKTAPEMGSYGAFVYVTVGTDHTYIEDQENITYTLTPVGPLIDGSQGEVITRAGGASRTAEYGKILDIPVGRYRIKGVYAPPGMKPQTLRFKNNWVRNSQFTEELEFVISAEGNFCSNCAGLDVESLHPAEPQ